MDDMNDPIDGYTDLYALIDRLREFAKELQRQSDKYYGLWKVGEGLVDDMKARVPDTTALKLLREVEGHFAEGHDDDGMDLWRRISDFLGGKTIAEMLNCKVAPDGSIVRASDEHAGPPVSGAMKSGDGGVAPQEVGGHSDLPRPAPAQDDSATVDSSPPTVNHAQDASAQMDASNAYGPMIRKANVQQERTCPHLPICFECFVPCTGCGKPMEDKGAEKQWCPACACKAGDK